MPKRDLEHGVFESHTEYEKQREATSYFQQVTTAYLDVRNNIPPITAISCDPEVQNRKLSADLIHFIADVENASRRALGNNPKLFEQWQKLVIDGVAVPNEDCIVARCARLYRDRQLAPVTYFRVIKKGRRDRRPVTVPTAGAA